MEYRDHVVAITGAAGATGQTAARAFAERGAALALLGSDRGRLEDLAGALRLGADRTLVHAADLRTAAGASAAAQAIQGRWGRADVLLHLVGGWTGGRLLAEAPAADLEAMLQQHVWTTFHIAQAFGPLLAASGRGRFIAVTSPAATRPPAKSGPYAAAKAAQEALVLTLAQELREQGVTANLLQVRAIDAEHKRLAAPTPANAGWTTPEEITAAILYLCSEAGGRVTGARLPLFAAPA
jgi:NAD(P)-dependent dehydrogenase (short-subunit alcohol dehydrogenase family)